ncbi:MAG: methyltransferase domain-containing protein [Bdellovibrionales bacterium]|nr:methyltransferase domain-containing protein [Bdellovibrionales bacterium]
MDWLRFIKAAVRRPKQVGALLPSSQYLAEEMIRDVPERPSGLVVEVGPGTGPITAPLLQRLADPAVYLGIDANDQFLTTLARRYPQAAFVHDTVEHLERHLPEGKHAAHVVCSLPWAIFAPAMQESILGTLVRALGPGGTFATFAYQHGRVVPRGKAFRKLLDRQFREVTVSPVILRNVPPAVVYHCAK